MWKATAPTLSPCPNRACGELKPPHQACPTCGGGGINEIPKILADAVNYTSGGLAVGATSRRTGEQSGARAGKDQQADPALHGSPGPLQQEGGFADPGVALEDEDTGQILLNELHADIPSGRVEQAAAAANKISQFIDEIETNRRKIEAVTGKYARHFCYPSGNYDMRFLPWLADLGVRSATTCDPGPP